jgi:hypothetical protein
MGERQVDHVQLHRDWVNCSHGRDGKVFVWQFGEDNEMNLERGLPSDGGVRRKPWLLHSMDVKEMTFCGMDVVGRKEVHNHYFLLIEGRIDCSLFWRPW